MRWAVPLLVLLAACGSRTAAPEALYQQAELEFQQSRWTEALATLDRAPADPRFLLLRAEVLLGRGDRAAAEALLPQVPYSEPALEARRLMHLGNAARLRGEIDVALARLREAAALAGQDENLAAGIDLRLALVLTRRGDYGGAEAAARRALAYAERMKLPYVEMQACGNLGFVSLNAHRYEEGIAWFERVRRLSQTPGNEEKALGNMALCYRGLGDLERALDNLGKAERLAEQAGQQHDAMVWMGQAGAMLYERGEFSAAGERFARALAASEKLVTSFTPIWSYNLAGTKLELGDITEAERYLDKAEKLSDPKDLGTRPALLLIRARLTEAKGGDAERRYQEVAEEKRFDSGARREALGRWARLLVKAGRRNEAEGKYAELLALGEAERAGLERVEWRITYGAGLAQLAAEYVDFLMQEGRTEKALEVAVAGRGKMLGGAGMAAAAIRRLAGERGSTILFYSVGAERSWLWVVNTGGIRAFEIAGGRVLAPLVERYRQFIEGLRDPKASEDPARRRLTELLLGPAREALPVGARVLLAPDGVLQSLNFETLESPWGGGRYWIEDATVTVVPSLALLGVRRGRQEGKGMLLVGAPATMPEPYQPLPYAREEMAAVAAQFGAVTRLEGLLVRVSACSRSLSASIGTRISPCTRWPTRWTRCTRPCCCRRARKGRQ